MSRRYVGPYVNFQGRAREAMEFYQKALGGKVDLHPASGKRITHARLEGDGFIIVGSDGHPTYPPTAGDNMAIALGGSDRENLTRPFMTWPRAGRSRAGLLPSRRAPKTAISWTSSASTGWSASKSSDAHQPK